MMNPTDEWLLLLNFYLIVNSAGELTTHDFSEARLAQAHQENPGESFNDMDVTARKLVLEFQAQRQDTELKNEVARRGHSPLPALAGRGEIKEIPDGPISIPLPDLPGSV
ncbi:MAG TPA: hypothetical protein VEC96_16510 [Anaerolineae bacterium]|nr:hypothetical protein [Anaerolineae bacterium]